jgi:hypothetical protein
MKALDLRQKMVSKALAARLAYLKTLATQR